MAAKGALLTGEETAFARAVSTLVYCNPFLPERIDGERQALGRDFMPEDTLWHPRTLPRKTTNLLHLHERTEALADTVRARLDRAGRATAEERELYEDLVTYLLFSRYVDPFFALITAKPETSAPVTFYQDFAADVQRYLGEPKGMFSWPDETTHLFACFFQVRRAFHYIFRNIMGGSMPAVRLRAAVWQSIFTRDIKRYRRGLYRRMSDIATLVSGPSGTGKELVAQAIGHSRYIPFDTDRSAFAEDFRASFYALNPSALSPTLIESELFGHRRGAFTGALQDRAGWLEVCPSLGTVFLDEIGELDVALQVKLLRVLQSRVFQRLGDTKDRRFDGKIIAATNRDLAVEIQARRFREDLYYRLCSDLITTPALDEQLRDAPGELGTLVLYIAQRVAGDEEADHLAEETLGWIRAHLGRGYTWPGNVRELEQCVRNVMIRGEYRPHRAGAVTARGRFADAVLQGTLTAEELVRRYCTLVYVQTGSYQETARRLGIDRRTVKEKLDPALLEELRGPGSPPRDADDEPPAGRAGRLPE